MFPYDFVKYIFCEFDPCLLFLFFYAYQYLQCLCVLTSPVLNFGGGSGGHNLTFSFTKWSNSSTWRFDILSYIRSKIVERLFFFLRFYLFLYFYFMCISVMSVHLMQCPQSPEDGWLEGFGSPGTEVTDCCELPFGYWKSNKDPSSRKAASVLNSWGMCSHCLLSVLSEFCNIPLPIFFHFHFFFLF